MRNFLFFALFFLTNVAVVMAQKTAIQPFVIGEIREIESAQLSEKRSLNVYLPEGYAADDTTDYPVIYLLDGSADEDFIHIAGLVQFLSFPWINALPRSIVVGITNIDRKRDFTYPTTIEDDKKAFPTTGGSEKFIAFIEQELQPFIEKNYRCNASKTIIGQSLGGLLATEILFKKPQLFNQYLIISPSLWWDDGSLFSIYKTANITTETRVYVAVGKEGARMEGDAKKLAGILKKNSQLKVDFEFLSKEDHTNVLHLAVYRAFQPIKK